MTSFEGLVQMLKYNREQKTVEETDLEQNICPYCLIQLKINPKTNKRSCSLCERIYDGGT